jgi:hypothetical protein
MTLARLAVCGSALGFAAALRRIRSPVTASLGVFLISLALAGCFILGISIKQQGAEFRSASSASVGYLTVLALIGASRVEIVYIMLMLLLLNVLGLLIPARARRGAWLAHHLERQRNREFEDRVVRDRRQ